MQMLYTTKFELWKIISQKRLRLIQLLVLFGLLGIGCTPKPTNSPQRLTIGLVSYGDEKVSLDKYEPFKNYIEAQTKSIVELEPAYNELQAIEQVQHKKWDIVFAPPGLAAIAISKELYLPLFSMEEISSKQRCLLIVRDDKPIQKISDLANKTVALGEIGSAAGYYVPLYDLYGLTLAQIRFAPTPKTVLQWISEGSVDAGALSEKDFNSYRQDFGETKFKILHTSRWIPPAVVLAGPTVDHNLYAQIRKVMSEAPGNIAADAGYIPNTKTPNYDQFIKLIEKVKPLEDHLKQTPVVLTNPAKI